MNARSIVLSGSILLLSVSILFGWIGFVEAQQPTFSDIALYNEEATQQTGGSAFPGPRRGPEIARKGTDQKETAGRRSEETDPSGSFITESPDPLVMGMDAVKADDPAYRTAYRDCMRQRMGKGR
jgi:hypothetical protein